MEPQDIATIVRVCLVTFTLGVNALIIGHWLAVLPLAIFVLWQFVN